MTPERSKRFLPSDTLIKVLQRFGVQEDAKSYLLDGVGIADEAGPHPGIRELWTAG